MRNPPVVETPATTASEERGASALPFHEATPPATMKNESSGLYAGATTGVRLKSTPPSPTPPSRLCSRHSTRPEHPIPDARLAQ